MITIALAVDEDVRWSVIVPKSKEKELKLFRLKIKTEQVGDSETHTLVAESAGPGINLAAWPNQVQSYDLEKGVYLIHTNEGLCYEDLKQVRVYVHGGKDPWPPPPPPAPQGTDLEKHKQVYEEGIDRVTVAAASGVSRWIEVRALGLPVVEGERG